MAKINTINWVEFPITDFFDLSLPSGDLQVKRVEDGDVPLITPSNFNNGLLQRISSDSESTKYKAKSLTVDMFGNAYYQEEDFFVTAHGHVNVLIPKKDINLYVGFFMASAIKAMFHNKYSFSEMCTQKVLKKEKIALPVDSEGEPDWNYMENYMKEAMKEAEKLLPKLQNLQKKNPIDVTSWSEFRVGDLFYKLDLKCKKENFNKVTDCSETKNEEFSLPLVNAKHFNNGIQFYGRPDEWDSEEMTIDIVSNGAIATGDVYAQPQRTGVLWDAYLIKCVYDIQSENVLHYLACVIEKCVKQYFSWSDKCTWDKVKEKMIKLPTGKNGIPDWEYMESYMKEMIERTDEAVQMLTV